MRIIDNALEELAHSAAELAHRGYYVFPCAFDKSPCTEHGHKDATSNPRFAYDMFIRCRDARMVGVPMGETTMLVCIDVDPGGVAWHHTHWLQSNWHRLGDTLMHRTPRGGVHIIYRMPKTGPIIDCRQVVDGQRLLSIGVDVKGAGGYIIWHGPGYEVINDRPPAEMPIWLKNRLIRQPKKPKEMRPVQIHNGARGLEAALAKVENTKEGNRNDFLFWAACRAGELVREGVLSEANAISLCAQSGRKAGLSELEAQRTAKSGVNKGMG